MTGSAASSPPDPGRLRFYENPRVVGVLAIIAGALGVARGALGLLGVAAQRALVNWMPVSDRANAFDAPWAEAQRRNAAAALRQGPAWIAGGLALAWLGLRLCRRQPLRRPPPRPPAPRPPS